MNRPAYPSDDRDEAWALVLPYLTLAPLEASQHKYVLHKVFIVQTQADDPSLGHLPALVATAVCEQERARVGALSQQVQAVTGEPVEGIALA